MYTGSNYTGRKSQFYSVPPQKCSSEVLWPPAPLEGCQMYFVSALNALHHCCALTKHLICSIVVVVKIHEIVKIKEYTFLIWWGHKESSLYKVHWSSSAGFLTKNQFWLLTSRAGHKKSQSGAKFLSRSLETAVPKAVRKQNQLNLLKTWFKGWNLSF